MEQEQPVDLLEEHRNKNRAPRPPNPKTFHRQPVAPGSDLEPNNNADTNNNNDTEEDNDDDDEGPEGLTNGRRTSNEAETLKFYPPGWRVVITRAKQYWRLHVATENPFPNCAEHLADAAALLTRAIKEYREEDGILESGSIFFRFFVSLILTDMTYV